MCPHRSLLYSVFGLSFLGVISLCIGGRKVVHLMLNLRERPPAKTDIEAGEFCRFQLASERQDEQHAQHAERVSVNYK
jgi:hypothetical protein